jgi:hypothetical protein
MGPPGKQMPSSAGHPDLNLEAIRFQYEDIREREYRRDFPERGR